MDLLMFILVGAVIVASVIWGVLAARRRREAFALLAARLGLRFSPDHDRGLAARFQFLDKLARGENRYAYNVLSGNYREHAVLTFDYHYETHSRDSKGNRRTNHHHFSFFILTLARSFPELTIAREGILSKVAQAFGYDDIDFESHEFSRKFCVRSRDKKFAYDVCHTRMMEYVLANPDLTIEIEDCALAIAFAHCLKPEEIEPNLERLVQIRMLMPDYLFASV